jgi:hypothetical protein
VAAKWPTIAAQYCAFDQPLSNQNLAYLWLYQQNSEIQMVEFSLTMVDRSVFTAHKPQCWGQFEART